MTDAADRLYDALVGIQQARGRAVLGEIDVLDAAHNAGLPRLINRDDAADVNRAFWELDARGAIVLMARGTVPITFTLVPRLDPAHSAVR